MVTIDIAKKLKEVKDFSVFMDNGYFLKDGIEYYKPRIDALYTSRVGERFWGLSYYDFEDGEEPKNGEDIIFAPDEEDILRWLRKEKKLYICIDLGSSGWFWDIHRIGNDGSSEFWYGNIASNRYDLKTYDEAVNDSISYLLDNNII